MLFKWVATLKTIARIYLHQIPGNFPRARTQNISSQGPTETLSVSGNLHEAFITCHK